MRQSSRLPINSFIFRWQSTHISHAINLCPFLPLIYLINTWPSNEGQSRGLEGRVEEKGSLFSLKIPSFLHLKVSPKSYMKDGQQCGHTVINYLPYEKLWQSTGERDCCVIYDTGQRLCRQRLLLRFQGVDLNTGVSSYHLESSLNIPLFLSFIFSKPCIVPHKTTFKPFSFKLSPWYLWMTKIYVVSWVLVHPTKTSSILFDASELDNKVWLDLR